MTLADASPYTRAAVAGLFRSSGVLVSNWFVCGVVVEVGMEKGADIVAA
ncbi:MAG: hypothetical protein JNN21_10690 [Candidatus Accumulibacter sp.]|nr:hypothetical protein [Accumulibacter sp.]MBL8392325.1 hypothetical protein [Accumulibacter sp.]HRD87681.1 hypothetical protein [Accumulibacter sp.]